MTRRKTHEEFIQEVRDKYEDEYTVLGEYKTNKTKILVKHNICDHEWNAIPSNLLRGQGCPDCGKIKSKISQTKTHEEFVKEIKDKYGNEYEVLGKYINRKTKILVRHNCGKCKFSKYEVAPANMLNGNGCPVCANQKIVLGINTIWDTDRWMVDLGVSEEDAKRYSSRSHKKIVIKCPDCGEEKKMVIANIYNYKSIGCSCGNSNSYSEKFLIDLLEQLSLDFETEYSPKWIRPKRYDFYIKDNACIIETHGIQHYNGSFKNIGGKTLQEEQANDKYKKEMALNNGVKYYIELDCRESNLEWIKNSILNSKLSKLFDLSNINWTSCAKFANKNIVKEVCNYWNNRKEDETTTDLSKRFKLDKKIIRIYLKKGTKLGWCNYDVNEEIRKTRLKVGGHNKKKVEIFKNGKSLGIFPSCAELSRQSEKLFGVKLNGGNISSNCNNKVTQYKGFIFKYVEEDK